LRLQAQQTAPLPAHSVRRSRLCGSIQPITPSHTVTSATGDRASALPSRLLPRRWHVSYRRGCYGAMVRSALEHSFDRRLFDPPNLSREAPSMVWMPSEADAYWYGGSAGQT
jgi:hypothetical protein